MLFCTDYLLHVEGDNFVTGVSNEVAMPRMLLMWSYRRPARHVYTDRKFHSVTLL